MTFPVNSSSTITAPIRRTLRVLQRSKVSRTIRQAQVFNCRRISGSWTWSQHAWGNAADLFTRTAEENRRVANHVVLQATKRTIANRGRKLAIAEVIDHQNHRIWLRYLGWRHYTGASGLHVHVSGHPLRDGTPPCAR